MNRIPTTFEQRLVNAVQSRGAPGARGRITSAHPVREQRRHIYEPEPVSMLFWYHPDSLPADGELLTGYDDTSGNDRHLDLLAAGTPAATITTANGAKAVNMGNGTQLGHTLTTGLATDELTVFFVGGWGPFNGINPAASYEVTPFQLYGTSPHGAFNESWLYGYFGYDGANHYANLAAEGTANGTDPDIDIETANGPTTPLLIQATRDLTGATFRFHDGPLIVAPADLAPVLLETIWIQSWQGPLNEIRGYGAGVDVSSVRAELNATYTLGLSD